MWRPLKDLGRSWFWLTAEEQQALALLVLLLFLGAVGRWAYPRHIARPAGVPPPPATVLAEPPADE